MKFLSAWLSIFFVAIVGSGCSKPEKILPSEQGLWDIKSTHALIYNDGALISDITETVDSLGQVYFGVDGTGWTAYYTNDPHAAFTWAISDKNDALLITWNPGEVDILPILKINKDSFVFQDTTTSLIGTNAPPYVRYVESTMTLERVK